MHNLMVYSRVKLYLWPSWSFWLMFLQPYVQIDPYIRETESKLVVNNVVCYKHVTHRYQNSGPWKQTCRFSLYHHQHEPENIVCARTEYGCNTTRSKLLCFILGHWDHAHFQSGGIKQD
jgi:hypothetical protein